MAADRLFPDYCRPPYLAPPADLSCLSCPMCGQVFERPVEMECGATVCAGCLITWVENHELLLCPCCESTSMDSHIRKPSTCVVTLLKGLLVNCPQGCRMVVRADKFIGHVESKCRDFYESSSDSPSRLTVKEMLSRSSNHPVTHSEKKVAENLIKRMMAESSDEAILRVPTRGQVC